MVSGALLVCISDISKQIDQSLISRQMLKKLIQVAINDFKLVFRDGSLRFFLVFPLLNLIVVRYGFTLVSESFPILKDYIHVLLMAATTQGSLMFGFIYSMILIDEKDTHVAKVYGVLPVSKFWFVIFRLLTPFLFSTIATVLMLLVEPFYGFSFFENVIYSMLTGLIAPTMALFVATIAKNKIEGMTWQKLFNLPTSLPLLVFFIPASFSFAFAVFPTHWAYQGLNQMILDGHYATFLSIGFLYSLLVISFLAQRFSKSHFA